ncbi:HypC/HybG/HupF family hydrogenase formation chaperone [Rhodopseudomonas palustris]|uniref:Hydrogenase expression/formation protein (HUPF/HYPC) n=1 Tax=Rhodopseudomonas palustris (strain BisB18) TaxID=316056 RepID=Q20XQ3_RHOPB
MCIALPCKIVAVADSALMLVAVAAEGESAHEIVSAALLVSPQRPVEDLVGAFVLIHAGFAISRIDEAEARSRQQVFAALRGGTDAIDLDDFYASTTDAPALPGFCAERRPLPDTAS